MLKDRSVHSFTCTNMRSCLINLMRRNDCVSDWQNHQCSRKQWLKKSQIISLIESSSKANKLTYVCINVWKSDRQFECHSLHSNHRLRTYWWFCQSRSPTHMYNEKHSLDLVLVGITYLRKSSSFNSAFINESHPHTRSRNWSYRYIGLHTKINFNGDLIIQKITIQKITDLNNTNNKA